MGEIKVLAADIELDSTGRVVLDDALLEMIAQYDVGIATAGGTNSNCSNNGCSNNGCNSASQSNFGCTNNSCSNNQNVRCVNNVDGGGG